MIDDLCHALDAELGVSITASIRHVELLREKEEKLEAARHEAEHQFLHRVGSAFRCGEIDEHQLVAIWHRYRHLDLKGRLTRWNSNIDIPWKAMGQLARQLPNGPEGTWVGEYPLPETDPAPKSGTSVVYVLFGTDNEPCYVGSTDALRGRLHAHRRDGKHFVRWQAHPCRDRLHAYLLEDRLLKQHKPYLNRKASR